MLTTQQHHHHQSPSLGHTSPQKLPRNTDEQSQLDDILSELLGEQALNDRALVPGSTRSGAISPSHGSLTTHSGNSRTVVSWESSNAGPMKSATVTKHTVGKPAPNAHTETTQTLHKEEYSYSSSVPSHKSSSMGSSSPPKLPPNAFSYGGVQEARRIHETHSGMKSPTPPPRDSSKGRVTSPTFRERVVSPTISTTVRNRAPSPVFGTTSSPPPTKFTSVPYRVDYENEASRGYYSDSEHSLSWLQQQQAKLQARREGRGSLDQRSRQEKQLVNELRNAQSSLQRRRAESESQEREILEQYSRQDIGGVFSAVPTTNGVPPYATVKGDERRPIGGKLQRSASALESGEYTKAEKKYWVTGVERPPFTTHQTKYTFSVSPPKNSTDSLRNKPPPGPYGRSAPTSPIIPQKNTTTSTSQSQNQRSKSVTKEWQSQGRQHPIATLPRGRIPTHQSSPLTSSTMPRSRSQSPIFFNRHAKSRSPSPTIPTYSARTIQYKSPKSARQPGVGLSRSATLPRNFRQQGGVSKFQPISRGDSKEEQELVEHHREEIIVRRPVVDTSGTGKMVLRGYGDKGHEVEFLVSSGFCGNLRGLFHFRECGLG